MSKPLLCLIATLAAALPAAASSACRIVAAGAAPRVVELYTSEGCNSCPPADRWLSTLRGRADVLATAFHVDYWDRLGWRDRFGRPEHTALQAERQARSGARFSYTPQVLVDGRDWRRWPELPPAPAPAGVTITIVRDGDRASLGVQAPAEAAARVALWWALLEDGHETAVQAGENAGVRLRHDHVVRRFGTLQAGQAAGRPATNLDAPAVGEGGRATRLLVVAHDAATGRTLQAAQLACGAATS